MKIEIAFLCIVFILCGCNSRPASTSGTDSSAKSAKLNAPSDISYADIDPFISVKNMKAKEVEQLMGQMLVADQQYRDSLHNGNKDHEAFYVRKINANDEANLLILDKIVQEYGWPAISIYGTSAAETAWLIIWHQRGKRHMLCKYFDLMENAAARKEMNAASFNQIKEAVELLSPDQVVY